MTEPAEPCPPVNPVLPDGRARRIRALGRVLGISLLAGLLVWREGGRADSWVGRVDAALLAVVQEFLPGDGTQALVLESAPDADTRVFAPRPRHDVLPVDMVMYRKGDASALFHWPPGPLDVAVVLDALAQSGARGIALGQVAWQGQDEGTLAGRVFSASRTALGNIPFVAAVEPGWSAVPAENAAALFADWPTLPADRVVGDITALPEVNDPGPTHAPSLPDPSKESDNSKDSQQPTIAPDPVGVVPKDFGFSRLIVSDPLDAPPGRVAVPLLARSGSQIFPSMALLLWARALGQDLQTIDVRLGRAILLGNASAPIDARGCLVLPVAHLARLGTVSALELAKAAENEDTEPDTTRKVEGRFIVIAHEAQAQVGPEGRKASTAEWQAAALGAMAAGDFGQPIRVLRRSPASVVPVICGVFVFCALWSLSLPRRLRGAAALFPGILYLAATGHAAGAFGVFHDMTLPCVVFSAAVGSAWLQRDPEIPR